MVGYSANPCSGAGSGPASYTDLWLLGEINAKMGRERRPLVKKVVGRGWLLPVGTFG